MNPQSTTKRKKVFPIDPRGFFQEIELKNWQSNVSLIQNWRYIHMKKIIMSNATSLQFDCIGPIHK